MMMKNIFFSVAVFLILSNVACTNSRNAVPIVDKTKENISKGILKGTLTDDVKLTKPTYKLMGSFIVKDGAKLTIPAGTKIEVESKGTEVYIAVLRGGQIFVKGTAEKPVVIASKMARAGDWGGLVICGKAETTSGVDATAEVGGFKYGGTKINDSSGSITYLVVKGTGAQINAESQYNGISFYAVGNGTKVENIAVMDGADDGLEFFGGSVNATNIYLENNEDDSVDWTEGWNGMLTTIYISHTKTGFSTAIEGDKENGNPKLNGLTAVNTVPNFGKALQFKKQSGATITNLWLEGYKTNIDMKDGGALSNVKIEGKSASTTATYQKSGAKIDPISWAWKNANL